MAVFEARLLGAGGLHALPTVRRCTLGASRWLQQ